MREHKYQEGNINIHTCSVLKEILNPAKEQSIRHHFFTALMIACPKPRIWIHEQHSLISCFPNYKSSVLALYYLVRSYIPCCCPALKITKLFSEPVQMEQLSFEPLQQEPNSTHTLSSISSDPAQRHPDRTQLAHVYELRDNLAFPPNWPGD